MKKYYIATSLIGRKFAIVSDEEMDSTKYKELNEVSPVECEAQAMETKLIVILNGTTRSYIFNSARSEYDCVYNSAGTKQGANYWGFVK